MKKGIYGIVNKEMWRYCSWSEYIRIQKRGVGTAFAFEELPEKIVYGQEAKKWGIIYISTGVFICTFNLILAYIQLLPLR